MTRTTCAAPGCRRIANDGRWCPDHVDLAGLPPPPTAGQWAGGSERQSEEARQLAGVIADLGSVPTLEAEIGAVRLVLDRLLLEETDLSRLVTGVARLAGVTVQAVRAERAAAESPQGRLAGLLDELLDGLDDEGG